MSEFRFLTARLVVNFFAVLAVTALIPEGIRFPEPGTRQFWIAVMVFAAVLAVLNAYVRPAVELVLKPLTCLLGLLTLGLSHFAINAAVFWIASLTVTEIEITGVGAALLGALIVSAVGLLGSMLLGGRKG